MLEPALPRPGRRRQRRMPHPSMPAQVIAVNAVLVSAAVLAAVVAAQLDLQIGDEKRRFYVLIAAILATVLVNGLAVRRRFEPLERLIDTMEQVDATERARPALPSGGTEEVTRLYVAFDGMLDRLEVERSRTAGAVLRAQEAERARIARDLHDEANQALTGVILRLQATAQDAPPELREELRQTREAASQAMEELLRLARELRPAALDDLGLTAALRTQVADFGSQTGLVTNLDVDPQTLDELTSEQQVVVYRIVQESLSNVATHADAAHVHVSVTSDGTATLVRIADDGRGFAPGLVAGDAHGLLGMRERAALAGGALSIRSRPGAGTGIELRLEGGTT